MVGHQGADLVDANFPLDIIIHAGNIQPPRPTEFSQKKNKNYPLLWNEVLCFDEMNILKKILFENAKLKSLVGMMVSRNETSSATKFSKFWVDVIILSFLLNSISVSFDWRTQESWTKMAGMLFFFLLLKHEGRKRGKSLSKYQEKYGRILCFLAFCLLFFLE